MADFHTPAASITSALIKHHLHELMEDWSFNCFLYFYYFYVFLGYAYFTGILICSIFFRQSPPSLPPFTLEDKLY